MNALSLKARALRYLARREHSRAELERKLAPYAREAAREAADATADVAAQETAADAAGASDRTLDVATHAAELIRSALDDLAARGLLSDERAADALLTYQGRRFGTRRLKQTMLAKGLPAELVASTLRRSRATEYERALEVWRRRFGEPAADAAGRARQMRFLAGRGFDAEIVHRLVKGGDEAEG
jgi:regulatory protein